MEKDNPFKTHSEDIVYENHWIKVHEDKITHPSGGDGVYAYVETKDSVVIVAINSKNSIFLVRSFRYPTKEWVWELPGGGGEENEDINETARRELIEESALASDDWYTLGKTVVWNGLSTERQVSFLAMNVYETTPLESDDKNLICDGQFFSWSKVREMISSGEIGDNQTISAIYLAELYLSKEAGHEL